MTARKITLTQNSPGVPGSSESGDNFGAATAWGDVNGDGYADLVIGASFASPGGRSGARARILLESQAVRHRALIQ